MHAMAHTYTLCASHAQMAVDVAVTVGLFVASWARCQAADWAGQHGDRQLHEVSLPDIAKVCADLDVLRKADMGAALNYFEVCMPVHARACAC